AFSKSNNKAEDSYREKTDIITLIVIGAFVGFVSGLLGIGGGIIFFYYFPESVPFSSKVNEQGL
ncbi:MAG: hypothetical protein ACPLYF_03310, partial [Fervidobacterium sp.]